jgi:hypothetical protein
MSIDDWIFSWLVLLLLGGLHGLNPAMGWLFAVALGMNRGDPRLVHRSLVPLAVGHAAAIAFALLLTAALGLVLDTHALQWVLAGTLLGFGVLHLRRPLHPRFGGMRMGMGALALWSFLMASAHGAGLMAIPFVPGAATAGSGVAELRARTAAEAPAATEHLHTSSTPNRRATAPSDHRHDAHLARAAEGRRGAALLAVLVHTLGYLLVAGLLATVVYHRVGLRLLRSTWVNLDVLWAGALILTAVLIPLL